MKVNVFIKTYNTFKAQKNKDSAVSHAMIKDKVLGYAEKLNVAKKLAKRICYTPDGSKFEVKSSMMAFLYVIELLRNYTNFEFSDDEVVSVYDSLDQCGALTDIINTIPEKERSEIDVLTKLCVDDEIQNHGSPLNQIVDTINALYSSIGELANNFTEEEKAKIIDLASAKFGKGE